MRTLADRFHDKVSPEPNSGCWLWTAGATHDGYGTIGLGGTTERGTAKMGLAHRVSYELFRGPIPPGAVIDHLCRVRACVNPAHLRAVTQTENLSAPGSRSAGNSAGQERCQRGHSDWWTRPDGDRRCRACHRMRDRA